MRPARRTSVRISALTTRVSIQRPIRCPRLMAGGRLPRPVRVLQVDPSAFTPPYDRALSAALARAGAEVTLATSRFDYGAVPPARAYTADERAFYRLLPGTPGSRARLAAKLAQHAPDMLRLRRRARRFDVVHF